MRLGLLALLGKAVAGGVQRADDLAFVIAQAEDLNVDYVCLRNLRWGQAPCSWHDHGPISKTISLALRIIPVQEVTDFAKLGVRLDIASHFTEPGFADKS